MRALSENISEAINLHLFSPENLCESDDAENLALGSTLLNGTLSVQCFGTTTGAQGDANMVLTPTGDFGNYFHRESRQESRVEWLENGGRTLTNGIGVSDLKFGLSVARISSFGRAMNHPVEIRDLQGHLLKQTAPCGQGALDQTDMEVSVYAQGRSMPTPRLALDFGARLENLTNHFNPLDVHANLSDPLNGVFFGNYVRRFRGDFDVLF